MHPAAATVSQPSSGADRTLFSSDYYRKVTKTTDIAGRLPNAVYTLPPRLVQAIVGRAELSAATREALVAECKKFFLAHREYEESKETFVDVCYNMSTTITLDCGRLYSEGDNHGGQCGIGSEEKVIGPRLIRLPPVLQVWHRGSRWFADTTRGLYAWGRNSSGRLGVDDDENVRKPRRVLIDGDVLDVSLLPGASFFRTDSGWFGCGANRGGQLGLGHTDEVITPAPIPGSEGVTRWRGNYAITFGFSDDCDDSLLVCGKNSYGQCGVGSTDDEITTLTPVDLPDDVKGRVDRVVCYGDSSFFITGRRCFAVGFNGDGELGLGSDAVAIPTPTSCRSPSG